MLNYWLISISVNFKWYHQVPSCLGQKSWTHPPVPPTLHIQFVSQCCFSIFRTHSKFDHFNLPPALSCDIFLYSPYYLPWYCKSIGDPHYVWILFLWIHLLVKIHLRSENQFLWCFHGLSWTPTEREKIWVTQWARSQLRSNKATLCLLVSALIP